MNTLIGQMLSLARGLDAEPRPDLDLPPWLAEPPRQQADALRRRRPA
jgi:hypothetical protein